MLSVQDPNRLYAELVRQLYKHAPIGIVALLLSAHPELRGQVDLIEHIIDEGLRAGEIAGIGCLILAAIL